METRKLGAEGAGSKSVNADGKGELKPKEAVRRVLEAAGAEVSDKKAFWLGHHMVRFVNYTRKHGELLGYVC